MHTPGQWKVLENGYPLGTHSVNVDTHTRIATVKTWDSTESCPTYGWAKEGYDNLRLIAAAPALLEALKDLVRADKARMGRKPVKLLIELAKDAIDLATKEVT